MYKGWLPSALLMHVPYELFWKLNPKKLEPFQKAAEMEQKAMQNRLNLTAWVTGVYIQHAVASCFSKGAKYPQKPLDIFGTEAKPTPQQEVEMFERFMVAHNAQREVKDSHA